MSNVALVKTGKGKPKFVDISQNLNVKATQDIPKYKEHVFYTKYAKHTPGTNLYTFDFPAEWKTTIATSLQFGIRAVYLIKSPRMLDWSLYIEMQRKDTKIWEDVTVNFFYTLSPSNTIYDYINYLNQESKPKCFSYFRWRYYSDRGQIILDGVLNDDYIDFSFKVLDPHAFDPIGKIECYDQNVIITTWDRETVLLKSTLTRQSENSHLGYTDTQYNPLKKYLINNPIPDSFTISSWVASTEKPVEFGSDGLDYVVLECVVEF
jgi:hypothetical protein